MMDASHKGEYTTCPGYTTKLPEVVEIARLRMHAKEGSLPLFMHGAEPTDVVVVGLEVLAGSTNECTTWAMENPEKKS